MPLRLPCRRWEAGQVHPLWWPGVRPTDRSHATRESSVSRVILQRREAKSRGDHRPRRPQQRGEEVVVVDMALTRGADHTREDLLGPCAAGRPIPATDPRRQGAAVVPPPLIRVSGGIRDRRVPRVGRARLAPLPPPGSAPVAPVPPRASVGVQNTDGRGCPCSGHDPPRLVVCASSLVRAADRGRWHPGRAGAGRGGCSVSAAVAGWCG